MPCAYPASIKGTHKGHPYREIIPRFSNAHKAPARGTAMYAINCVAKCKSVR